MSGERAIPRTAQTRAETKKNVDSKTSKMGEIRYLHFLILLVLFQLSVFWSRCMKFNSDTAGACQPTERFIR